MKRFHQILSTSVLLLALVISLSFVTKGQTSEKDAPATLIKAAIVLEQTPFGRDAKDLRGWAMRWIIATDKVSVKVCSLLLSGIDKKYKYTSELLSQYTIGMAAFKLANPDKSNDEDAVQMAGITSAISSYDAMVRDQPKARNAFMDGLVTKRSDGTLDQFMTANNCKEK
jgi:hypothetical protein